MQKNVIHLQAGDRITRLPNGKAVDWPVGKVERSADQQLHGQDAVAVTTTYQEQRPFLRGDVIVVRTAVMAARPIFFSYREVVEVAP